MTACSSLLLASVDEAGIVSPIVRLARCLCAIFGRLSARPTSGRSVPPGNLEDEHSATAHMLRTPLTSIRSFSEIMMDNPDLTPKQRAHYLAIVLCESERLEKAIDVVLREDDPIAELCPQSGTTGGP
jgi:hypothetical protein